MYREASAKRHSLLRKMRPEWRQIQQTLDRIGKNVGSVLDRSETIDRHMQEFEDITSGRDRAVSVLSSSSLVYFFVSMLVLAVAIGGATINFSLIARPMAEMVGGTNLIGGYRTADIAALVIIMVEISMGLFLMESLRITRLFPVIAALPDKMRVRMIWITFTLLFLLASVEAGLAYMRVRRGLRQQRPARYRQDELHGRNLHVVSQPRRVVFRRCDLPGRPRSEHEVRRLGNSVP